MTAVEWLEKQLTDAPYIHFGDLFEQAKEMEKQQIIDAYDKCYQDLSNTQKEVDKLATYVSELPQTEISDEEIEKYASDFYDNNGSESIFILGAKWYREQLKSR